MCVEVIYIIKYSIIKIYQMKKLFIITGTLFCFLNTYSQETQNKPDTLKTKQLKAVEIIGKVNVASKVAISPEASSSPASVTLVGRDYIGKQAINSYGDLLRPLAGLNVSNYQLGGVGYGIELRGYTVTEHARDVAFYIDGVPQNQGSSIQTNGYVDLNPLIPENLKRVEVIRGPFSPYYGDHAFGGVISFETMEKLPSSIILSGGSFGEARGLATFGFGHNSKTGYVSIEGERMDGYRANNKEKHLTGVAKYSFPFLSGMGSVKVQEYKSDFGSPGYLRIEDLDARKVNRTTAVNSSDGGTTNQQNLVFNYKGSDSINFNSAILYVQHHDFARIRTGRIGGNQRQDRDDRLWAGVDLRHTKITKLGSLPFLYAIGFNFRADNIYNTQFQTVNRTKISQSQDRHVQFNNPGIYLQSQLMFTYRLKFTLGARFDKFFYEIATGSNDKELTNVKLKPSTEAFSPKAGLAYQINKCINLFINAAKGIKSPSGYEENIFNQSLKPSNLISYEVGFAADDAIGRFHGLASAYLSDQTREIQQDPFGNIINFGNTRRKGIELDARVGLMESKGLSVFGNYTRVSAKIINGATDQIFVTSTPDYSATLGFDYDFGAAQKLNNHFVISLYDQFIGNKNLNQSGTVRSDAFQRIAAKLSLNLRNYPNFRLFAEGSFYPGEGSLQEVRFLSGSKVLSSPQAPFNFKLGVKIPF